MSAIDRIRWIFSEVSNGRSVSASFSYNAATGREKVKFVIQDTYSFKGVYRPCLLGAIAAVSDATAYSIVTDKGHRSDSKSTSVIEFWLKQPGDIDADGQDRTGHPMQCSSANVNEKITKDDSNTMLQEFTTELASASTGQGVGSPVTPVSKRVRIDSNEAARLTEIGCAPAGNVGQTSKVNMHISFDDEPEICGDLGANSGSSSRSADLLQTSLGSLGDEYSALQCDIIWEKLQPRLEELFQGLRGSMPSTLRRVFEIQRSSAGEDMADVLMPESRAILTTIIQNRVDFGGMVGNMSEAPEVKVLLAPRFAAFLEAEIDKILAFSTFSGDPGTVELRPPDADPVFQLAPVSARGMAQSKRKGRKK